jgi:hypothetical protein
MAAVAVKVSNSNVSSRLVYQPTHVHVINTAFHFTVEYTELTTITTTSLFHDLLYLTQQSILDTLQAHFDAHPHAQADVNLALIDKSEAALTELKVLAMRHKKSNLLTQFALSRKTQSLLDEASKNFTTAISKLQLGIAVSQMGVNLRIDENVSVIIG